MTTTQDQTAQDQAAQDQIGSKSGQMHSQQMHSVNPATGETFASYDTLTSQQV